MKSQFRKRITTFREELIGLDAVQQITGRKVSLNEVDSWIDQCPANSSNITTKCLVNAERTWESKSRPFFNLYEPVIRCLERTPLTIKPEQIPPSVVHELGVICVKFPTNWSHPLTKDVDYFYICFSENCLDFSKRSVSSDPVRLLRKPSIGFYWHTVEATFHNGAPWSETFQSMESAFTGSEWTDREVSQRQFITKIGLGVMLLAADPNYVKPVMLPKDRNKPIPEHKKVALAKRRGVFGFEIGADMEVSPHFRRPHFAIRWTGKGGKVPKLVPVKGAIIHRNQLNVPTGFELSGDEPEGGAK